MKRILLTGISGVGKSTLVDELAARGYTAVDADCDTYSEWVEVTDELASAAGSPVEAHRDWVWREDRIEELLAPGTAGLLFVSGCAANMRRFLPCFDRVILLSAPASVIDERLRTRGASSYGNHPDQRARVLELKRSVEPLLRTIADCEIDTSRSLDQVLTEVLLAVPDPAGTSGI